MFGLLQTLLVLMLELHEILDQVFYLLMLLAVDLLQMVDFPLLFLEDVSDSRVLVFVGLELILESPVLLG